MQYGFLCILHIAIITGKIITITIIITITNRDIQYILRLFAVKEGDTWKKISSIHGENNGVNLTTHIFYQMF